MTRKHCWAVLLSAMIMLLLAVPPVWGADLMDGFKSLPAQTTADTKKAWTITFDTALARSSVNGNNIYMTNSNKIRLSFTLALSTDNLKVTVTPSQAYAAGDYYLYITKNIRSADGKKMAVPVAIPFTVTANATGTSGTGTSSSDYIANVDVDFSSYVPEVTVRTTAEVYKVNVNNITAQYLGDNIYSVGLYGLEEGSNLLIQAYDQKGRLVQSYTYSGS